MIGQILPHGHRPAGPTLPGAPTFDLDVSEVLTILAPAETRTMVSARLEELFEAHHQRLFRLARRLLRDADAARDAVQDVFVRAARHADRLPSGEPGGEAWLVRVLVNRCHDQNRQSRRRGAPAELSGNEESTASRPDASALARLSVEAALAALPPRRRAVVVLHELEERSVEEIAGLLGVARVTVRWHLSQGRKQLARVLAPTVAVETSR